MLQIGQGKGDALGKSVGRKDSFALVFLRGGGAGEEELAVL